MVSLIQGGDDPGPGGGPLKSVFRKTEAVSSWDQAGRAQTLQPLGFLTK